MSLEITVPAKYICAIKLFTAGEEDSRTQLHNIGFEVSPKTIFMYASNARMLGCFGIYNPNKSQIKETIIDILVPKDLFKAVKPSNGDVSLVFDDEFNDYDKYKKKWTLKYKKVDISYWVGRELKKASGETITNCAFGDWKKTFPEKTSGEVAQFDPKHIEILGKANRMLTSGRGDMVHISHNGEMPAIVHLDEQDFIGVMSSLNKNFFGFHVKTIPAWLEVYQRNARYEAENNKGGKKA
jgi:hypothetical protein